jgi:uncharacterized membrane protein
MTMKKSMLFCVLLFICEIVIEICLLPTLPPQNSIHWTWQWQDNVLRENWSLLLLPIITFLVIIVTYFSLSFRVKSNINLILSEKVSAIIIITMKLIFTTLFVEAILSAKGISDKLFQSERVIFLLCGIMLIVLGLITSKIKQNPDIGVRTPWTLKSNFVWQKTNILGGILFVVDGIAFIICQLLLSSYLNLYLPLAMVILCIPILLIYSWHLYKSENKTANGN